MTDKTDELQDEEWSWTRNYNPGLFQHMHALGVIAANYNQLENELGFLIHIFLSSERFANRPSTLSTSPKAYSYLLEHLNNAQRTGLLEQFYKEKLDGTELEDRLDWFVFGYRACAENRNMLMHSMPHGSTLNALQEISTLDLRRSSRKNPVDQLFISLELKELRQIADDIYSFARFGFDLALCVLASHRGGKMRFRGQEVPVPLPAKPLRPIVLKFSSEAPKNDPSGANGL